MAYRDRIQTYQRIRTVILRDAWLIDHDHREDKREDDVEEEASDAAFLTGARWQTSTAEQSGRSHQSDSQDHGSVSGHTNAPLGKAPTKDETRIKLRQHIKRRINLLLNGEYRI